MWYWIKSSDRIDTTDALTMDDDYKEMFISIGVDGVPDYYRSLA